MITQGVVWLPMLCPDMLWESRQLSHQHEVIRADSKGSILEGDGVGMMG